MIHHGDCLDVMATMPAESIDAVVTDPPYGLEFMGKEWDRFGDRRQPGDPTFHKSGAGPFDRATVRYGAYSGKTLAALVAFQSWCTEWGRAALRVTKPGGCLLAFGGTRTHHRLVCGLEDAGWIIRDELDWIYASGFPKGRANLKPAHEPIVMARKPGPLRPLAIDECRIGTADDVPATTQGLGARPDGEQMYGNGKGFRTERREFIPTAGRWPSNVLLSDPELFDEPNPAVVGSGTVMGPSAPASGPTWTGPSGSPSRSPFKGTDRDPQFYGDSGGYSRFFIIPKADRAERERGLAGGDVPRTDVPLVGLGNKYCEKCGEAWVNPDGLPKCGHGREFVKRRPAVAPKARANSHPTVKPIDLMRHLVRLVTPPRGTVLDPFAGSGSTLIACEMEGFDWVGIEKEAEYVAIAEARLNGTQRGLGLPA